MARYRLADPVESFRRGDAPAEISVELATIDGNPVSLEGITGATAELIDPAGIRHPLTAALVVADRITVGFGGLELGVGGVWSLELVVAGAGSSLAVEPAPLVVEHGDGWHTLASGRGQWADAPRVDVDMFELLELAKGQCIEYAPDLPAGAVVPLAWRQAQRMQARNIWNASKTDPASGGFGDGEFVLRPYPMDQTIRYMLRPKRAIGATA